MFFELLSIEWTCLSRRVILWLTLAACILYTGLSLANFYTLNRPQLANGGLKMPGASFDLANSLDQMLIAIPFLVIIGASMMGNDYAQRTNQQWLTRVPRSSSLLAKLTLLILLTLAIQVLTLATGGLVGLYYKHTVYGVPDLLNVNWTATAAAPLYMTLVNLPYLALTLALAVWLRSTFFSAVVGLGYAQVLDFMLTGLFHGAGWTRWLFTNVHFSASFLLNSIGNRSVELPAHILSPVAALLVAAAYTSIFLTIAVWLYRRQDLGR
jgi:ABC-type transport system involved in multi-copper enzyme maturation permease subunit